MSETTRSSSPAPRAIAGVGEDPPTARAAAAKLLAVLEAFAAHRGAAGVAELARAAALPKSTTHRVLGFLCDADFVRAEAGRYRLTAKVAALAPPDPEPVDPRLREHLLPYLTDLHEAVGKPVLLAVRSGGAAGVVHRVCGSRSAGFAAGLGDDVPLHCTAVGKALLAHSWAPGEPGGDLGRFTAATITFRRGLDRDLAAVRSTGIAVDLDEWRPGVRTTSTRPVPVRKSSRAGPTPVPVV
ncbi:helix-turn-helix domain-containing protein [Actinokineospora sp. PR83]|uniref:IclR family transcriptional regulator n=1 Tax=Actinokineospora sp. PR83 TaxID=2884908 RepID=UPI001F33A350|nr:helix-turn-helix domain-containing protein [Actinokineospora sp. PR83]MCG8917181.1 helix-turn-helix domain-containing protein [Actinokineospora sp. PR83]